jgi:hypothetical protein
LGNQNDGVRLTDEVLLERYTKVSVAPLLIIQHIDSLLRVSSIVSLVLWFG